MNPIKQLLLYFTFLILHFNCWSQQRVGLVLSGGGATGLAHIGVLKAIEERGIRIDYVTGTSAGALVGAMYAVGYSPEEMEAYVLSEDFQLMTTGKLNPKQEYLYRNQEENAGMINFSFAQDSILKKSLPTNFITSTFLDFEMLKLFGVPGAMHGNNFDSLMVPFRCVASDIVNKSSVVYGTGDLNAAIRASMTYPFYFNPIRVEGKLMFDGGLYNNFPADVMYSTFGPDFIIGSNVSGNAAPPSEDDLISQITNMLVSYSDFNLPCSSGIIIRPKTAISTFEFDQVKQAIDDGYRSAKLYLDSVDMTMVDTISKQELTARRNAFRKSTNSIYIDAISNNKIKRNDLFFVRNSILRTHKKEIISLEKLEKRYYRLYSAPQIDFLYPTLRRELDSLYKLNLDVRKVKDFRLDAGGHFSSRAVNTGYVGIDYRRIGKIATNLHGDSYFGKFYGSAALRMDVDLPFVLPLTLSPYLTLNRWDYFRSLATFFEDVKPSFLVQYEMYYGVKLKYPIGNTAKSSLDVRSFALENDYYQSSNFTSKDTTDITQFYGNSISWDFEKNTLNRKQYATSGHYFKIKARYIYGTEKTIPGSTSQMKLIDQNLHDWINLSATFQSFLIDKEHVHFGIHGQGVFNSQSLFSNYTSTLLMMNSFELVPDAATYFLPEYRSPQHVGAGINLVLSPYKNIDLRFDGYFYQPFVVLQKNNFGEPSYSKPFKGETYIASLTAIYHSLVGPMRATINYFPKQAVPLNFQLSYGYVLFNERALR